MDADSLPYGYRAVPLQQGQAPLQICVVCREQPDPLGKQLVELRETANVRALLGCVVDHSEQVLQWVELWVQRVGNAHFSTDQAPTNREAVDRWETVLHSPDQTGRIITGWEQGPLAATFISPKSLTVLTPGTSDGEEWLLCDDDSLLATAGLAPFSSSPHRYLSNGTRFIALGNSPTSGDARELADFWPESRHLIPLNPHAGNMTVRPYFPMDIEIFSDVLGGADWDGTWHGLDRIDTDGGRELLSKEMERIRPVYMLARQGAKATTIEVLYLKLQLWCEAIAAVAADTRANQAPLMNLSGESFRVSFPIGCARLPFLWSGSCHLSSPGNAVRHAMHGSEVPYFIDAAPGKPTPYRPQLATSGLRGRGQVMILDVMEEGDGLVVVGTLEVQEILGSRPGDLLELRLMGQGTVASLVGHLDANEDSFGGSEYTFRTRPQRFQPATRDWLTQTPGSRFPKCEYQILSLVGAPIDMYALAVLGLRIFCVDQTQNLATAVHAFDRLTNALDERYDDATALADRIATLYKEASYCAKALGPQRLTRSALSAEDALDVVTDVVWFAILGLLVRMMPAAGPDSLCQNFADGLEMGIHSVYTDVMRDAEELCQEVRSLVLCDWPANAEIGSIIAEFAG